MRLIDVNDRARIVVFFSLLWILGCEPAAQKTVVNSKESVPKTFDLSLVGADIDSSVLVERMTVLEVKSLLSKMVMADQQYRDSLYHGNKDRLSVYNNKISKNDEANLSLLRKIVRTYGWPTKNLFGREGTEAAWLILWHHRTERNTLAEFIGFMEVAYRKGQILPDEYTSIKKQLDFLEAGK